ncbi:MAG: sodium:solute symporter family protein [Zoogloeaceae bacterium]|jgi:SSS family transporter|nr:sodium:solute symporter family protein [Zoogloeaceae bacterium]
MELMGFVALYLAVSVLIGVITARWVHTSRDFAVAGRHLPLSVVTATVFATWFGSEAIFGASSIFVQEGNNLGSIIADPFGAAFCLIIAGFFFSAKLYKLNILTLGDYYRSRYGRTVEVLTTICIIIAYLGWVSAQIKVLGMVFSNLSDGAIDQTTGMIIGAAVVLTYTTVGGMLSVAVLDFIQMLLIIFGLAYIAYLVAGMAGGADVVIQHAADAGKLQFFPKDVGLKEWLIFLAPGITMMLGSIPQQDVFQRITSAKSAKIALHGSLIGGSFYLLFCFVPIFIAYAATLVLPETFNAEFFEHGDAEQIEQIIPILIQNTMPFAAKVLFFGAVISAIMSTASATLLAPSVSFAENIVRGYLPQLSDRGFLRVMRVCTVCFTIFVLIFAMLSMGTSVYEMVESAYKITLAGAFIPLIVGPFWKRATNQGALCSVVLGVVAWLLAEYSVEIMEMFASAPSPELLVSDPEESFDIKEVSSLIGLAFSGVGIVVGSLLPQWFPAGK